MTSNNQSRSVLPVAALALLMATAPGWAQTSQSTSSTTTTTTANTPSMPVASSSMNNADQTMLKEMAQTNLAEINAGKLALSKSQDPKVKEFAQKMVDEHTMALQDLQQIAQKKGVTLPGELDRAHTTMSSRLEKLSGAAFDQRYLAQGGLSDHAQAHAMLRRVENRAKDAELKAAAAKMEPIINQHLASARQIQREYRAGSTSTGSSAAGASGDSMTAPTGGTKSQYP